MKRRCSHRNPGTGKECMRTARDGSDTCTRHAPGYVAPKRAARVMPAEQAAEIDARLAAETLPERPAYGGPERSALWLLDDSTASAVSLAPQPAGPDAEPVEAVDQNPRDAHEAPPAHESADDPRRHTGGPVVDVAGDLLLSERGCEVWHCDWRRLAERARELGGVDALIVDAPYSERTHAGHDDGVVDANTYRGRPSKRTAASGRKPLSYSSWTVEEVAEFCATWGPLTRGWFATLTDHVLAPAWESALQDAGRYVFAPIAVVDSGSRVRLTGDGPPNWNVWLVVARPSRAPWNRWATIEARAARGADPMPGAYVIPPGVREARQGRTGVSGVVGGKPLWLMRALVRDYTRPGDLVCDPCMGAGTTALACVLEGRRFLGGDAMREHADISVERLRLMPGETKRGQLALLGRTGT